MEVGTQTGRQRQEASPMPPQNSQGGGWAGTDMKRWVAEIRVDTRASLNFPEFRAPVIIGRKYFILSTRKKV